MKGMQRGWQGTILALVIVMVMFMALLLRGCWCYGLNKFVGNVYFVTEVYCYYAAHGCDQRGGAVAWMTELLVVNRCPQRAELYSDTLPLDDRAGERPVS